MILYSSPNKGPKAVPGMYKAKLIYNDQEIIKEFEIKGDFENNLTAVHCWAGTGTRASNAVEKCHIRARAQSSRSLRNSAISID